MPRSRQAGIHLHHVRCDQRRRQPHDSTAPHAGAGPRGGACARDNTIVHWRGFLCGFVCVFLCVLAIWGWDGLGADVSLYLRAAEGLHCEHPHAFFTSVQIATLLCAGAHPSKLIFKDL